MNDFDFTPPNSYKRIHYVCIVGIGLLFYLVYNQMQDSNTELKNSLKKCKELKSQQKKLNAELMMLKEIEKIKRSEI